MVLRNFMDAGGGDGMGLSPTTTSKTLNKFIASPAPVPSPAAPYYGGTIPSPAAEQRVPNSPAAPYYGGSVPSPAAEQMAPIQGGYGGGGGGAAVSKPAMTFDQFTDDMAATDSVFMDQKSQYANALKKFIEDNDRQKGILDQDANTAQQGIARNRTNGLTGLSEDFASRGLANSGMFSQELGKADKQYDNQATQVKTGLKNAQDDLGFRRAKYEQENGENGSNIQAARREAFARLAASQNLT